MFSFQNTASPRVQRLSAADAITRAAAGELTLIDVRDNGEVNATGMADGAIHAPLMLLGFRADPRHPDHDPALVPNRPVAIYCASGGRAEMAGQMLLNLGYKEVYNIGGFGDWCAHGGARAA